MADSTRASKKVITVPLLTHILQENVPRRPGAHEDARVVLFFQFFVLQLIPIGLPFFVVLQGM